MRRLSRTLCLFALTLYVSECRAGSPLVLSGRLTDPVNEPLAGVSVLLISIDRVLQTQSDEDGRFTFSDVSPGSYEMDAKAPGFTRHRQQIQITPPAPLEIQLSVGDMPDMEACGAHQTIAYSPYRSGARLTGSIHRWTKGKPMKGVTVALWRTDEHTPALECRSDKLGYFALDAAPGYYRLRISEPGYENVEVKSLLLPNENSVIVLATLLERSNVIVCQ
jgi:5-hydroxyisourate hydrolase-like protein (transthyretin family)